VSCRWDNQGPFQGSGCPGVGVSKDLFQENGCPGTSVKGPLSKDLFKGVGVLVPGCQGAFSGECVSWHWGVNGPFQGGGCPGAGMPRYLFKRMGVLALAFLGTFSGEWMSWHWGVKTFSGEWVSCSGVFTGQRPFQRNECLDIGLPRDLFRGVGVLALACKGTFSGVGVSRDLFHGSGCPGVGVFRDHFRGVDVLTLTCQGNVSLGGGC
jgi:hypothetical protein